LPVVQRSFAEGGLRSEGPGPVNPPPIAIIIILTKTPKKPIMAEDTRSVFLGVTILLDFHYLIINVFLCKETDINLRL
jgi:hypothetical protein